MDQPAPEITKETKLLSIDVESNGLHGEAFAVGAVLMNAKGEVLDEFIGRCPVVGKIDPWVKDNVIKPMKDVPEDYPNAKKMRDAFWSWYLPAKNQADYVLADNGYPVEARFLIQCQDDDIEDRYWGHPFPLLDLASMLLQVGIKPLAVRKKMVEDKMGGAPSLHHNPRWDAQVSALAAFEAWKLSGQLKS
ncbi:MAG TPA: hypothetical protein VNA68_03270 [Candidatus Dormibacteraeota bacterium]|nr:hypothetical protein [Candidatus Dormibacteraeota bacterium]